jgi:hypothetical protein
VQVIDEYSNDVHFVEIDIEEDPEIAEAGGIMGTPTVQFFKNKQIIKYEIKHPLHDFTILGYDKHCSVCFEIFMWETRLRIFFLLKYNQLGGFILDHVDTGCMSTLFICRTISGVKMKKEYREIIEANKK